MEEKCKDNQQACVPNFAHEAALMHYNMTNRRMLIALLSVCVTFIITIIIFVTGYTAREKNWLDTISRMQITEAEDGVYKQPDS